MVPFKRKLHVKFEFPDRLQQTQHFVTFPTLMWSVAIETIDSVHDWIQRQRPALELYLFCWFPRVGSLIHLVTVTCHGLALVSFNSLISITVLRLWLWFILLSKFCQLYSDLSVCSLNFRLGSEAWPVLLLRKARVALFVVILMEKISVRGTNDSKTDQK